MRIAKLHDRFEGFFELLKYKLIMCKEGPSVKECAEALGINQNTFYFYLNGSRSLPLERLDELVTFVDDPELLAWFGEGAGFSVYREQTYSGSEVLDLMKGVLATQRSEVDVVSSVVNALADGKVTRAEREQILVEIGDLSATLAELRSAVIEAGKRGSGQAKASHPETARPKGEDDS